MKNVMHTWIKHFPMLLVSTDFFVADTNQSYCTVISCQNNFDHDFTIFFKKKWDYFFPCLFVQCGSKFLSK